MSRDQRCWHTESIDHVSDHVYVRCLARATPRSVLIVDRPMFVNADGSTRTKNSSLILVHAGDSVQLNCFVDSYPSSRVSWQVNGKILSFNETSLRLTDIQSHRHIGLYICHADHPLFGQFNQTIRVALKGSSLPSSNRRRRLFCSGPPEIIDDERVRSVHVGQSLSLVCSISAEIPIQVD